MHNAELFTDTEQAPARSAGASITLRPYQEEAVKAVLDGWKSHDAVMTVLPTGCHRAGQGVLMYDGSIKAVEDIAIGDQLMGPDSTPRNVIELIRNIGDMAEITPVKGDPFVVNLDHVLTLQKVNERSGKSERIYRSTLGGQLVDVSVRSYLQWSKYQKHLYKLVRAGVDFPPTPMLMIEPYMMGLILGDGSLSVDGTVGVSKPDKEIRDECYAYAERTGLAVRESDSNGTRCSTYYFKGGERSNWLIVELRSLGLLPIQSGDRFIPHAYKVASREARLEVLAGLLDTDGSMSHSGYDFGCKSIQMANDVVFIARSLGLFANVAIRKGGVADGHARVYISGDCSIIPCRIPRKKASPRQQKKSVLRTGFSVNLLAEQEPYFGFELDGDRRYLMDDFTITHNSGKTIICSDIIGKRLSEGRVLFVAHREELLFQTVDKAKMVLGSGISAGVVKAEYDECNRDIVVGSIQTLVRGNRLERILRHGQIGTVIIDECQHSSATTYRQFVTTLNAGKPGGPKLLGVTATPDRADRVGLNAVFEKIVYERTVFDMIDDGYLTDIQAMQIEIDGLDLSQVRTQRGDYVAADLGRQMMEAHAPSIIAKVVSEVIPDKKSIVFVPTVAMAGETAAAIQEAGIPAGVVSGGTPSDERRQILRDFSDGKIRAIANVGILTEGYDEPSVDAIVMAAPTKSRGRFVQMLGRGLRLYPGKEFCTVVDLTGNTSDHALQTVPTLFGLAPRDFKAKSLREIVEQARLDIAAGIYTGDLKISDLGNLRKARFHWVALPNGWHALPSESMTYILRYGGVTSMGVPGWEVWGVQGSRAMRLLEALPIETAQSTAEDRLRQSGEHNSILVKDDAPWRSHEMSLKQKNMLRIYGISTANIKTKGEAADAITAAKAMKAMEALLPKQRPARQWHEMVRR